MNMHERLATIEQQLREQNNKLTAIFDLLNPLKDSVAKHGTHIHWISRLGSIGLGLISLFSAWLAMRGK